MNNTYFVKNDYGVNPEFEKVRDVSIIEEENSIDETRISMKFNTSLNKNIDNEEDKYDDLKNKLSKANLKITDLSPRTKENISSPLTGSSSILKKTNSSNNIKKNTIKKVENNNIIRNIYRLKSILLGNVAVGKTSILNRYLTNKFSSEYTCSIGVEFKVKSININNNTTIDLQVWDTCGHEKFRTLTGQYYRDAHAVIFVFDLTNKKTFDDIELWLSDLKLHGPKTSVLILVGNKHDLDSQRVVDFNDAVKFASDNNMDYFEISAKNGLGIKFMFDIIARSLARQIEYGFSTNENQNFDIFDKRRGSSLVILPNKEIKDKKKCC